MGASYIQEIKEQADILDILRPFLSSPPKKQGSNYFALSPFNQEKTPSFSINRQKQIFKCFSSQKGGDVYTFLQEAQGMTFMESVRYVADQIGYQIPEADPKSEGIQKKKAAIYAVLKAASEIFHRQAKDQDFSSKFFEDRKIEDSNIDRFMLGCAYPAWSRLSQELLDKQFSKQVLLESGLAYEREGYVRDRYYRRIIFPIRDHLGRVCGFGGRKTDDDKDQKAKYINSSESIVYDKSSLLYGLYESKDLIRQAAKVYVVEGYTDVISLVKNDYPSVASCGTAITEPQVALMSRFTNNVVLWMDGDSAGIKATARAIPLFLAKGFNVKIATTSASDPDAYFTDQKKDLVEVDWMEWAYQHHVPQDGTPTEQAQGIREVEEYIQQLPFELDQRLYKKKLKELSGIEEQTITIEETKEAISTLKGKQNWTYYCELRERLGLAHSPDFEANDKGELIVSYKNIMDKPVRKAIGGKKQAVIRNITRGEEVFSVYVPHKFRTWRMDNEREKISQPLFIVHGELNAYLLDQMGIFCVGISHRLSFLSKKNSTRLSSTMRQVLEQDFGTVIYLAPGEIFHLPRVRKKASANPYLNQNAGAVAEDYVQVMRLMKDTMPAVNLLLSHLATEEYRLNDWVGELLQSVLMLAKQAPEYKDLRNNLINLFLGIPRKETDGMISVHNIGDQNINAYQKILQIDTPQTFFDFHGYPLLGEKFQLGKYLYEVDREGKVKMSEQSSDMQVIKEEEDRYWAKRKEGYWKEVSDFTIQPQLKILGTNPFVLAQIKTLRGSEYSIVLDSKLLINPDQFHLRVFGLANCYWHGSSSELRYMQQLVFNNIKTAHMIEQLGHNRVRGDKGYIEFYAFGNGIITYDEGFKPINDEGIVEYAGQTFFLPAEAEYRLSDDRDDVYATHQKFAYEEGSVTLSEYLELMFAVHGAAQAHVGIAFVLMSLYRDIVYKGSNRVIPNCYFQGETGSGKSTLRKSMSKLFGETPTVALNAHPTLASVGSLPFQVENGFVAMEEFNVFIMVNEKQKDIINLTKALYDGKTRSRRQDAQSDRLSNKAAKACLLTLGQEHFYTYDEALNNRFCVVEWPHDPPRNLEAYEQLTKVIEPEGLGHILESWLSYRSVIQDMYAEAFRGVEANLRKRIGQRKVLDRLIQNWAIIITPLLIIIKKGLIEYPWTVKEILDHAEESIIAHARKALKQGILGEFWSFIAQEYGRSIDHTMVFVYEKDGEEPEVRIRYKPLVGLFKAHLKRMGDNSIQMPSEQNLRNKILKHPAFLRESNTYMGFVIQADGRIKMTHQNDGGNVESKPVFAKRKCLRFEKKTLEAHEGIQLIEIDFGQIDYEDLEIPPVPLPSQESETLFPTNSFQTNYDTV